MFGHDNQDEDQKTNDAAVVTPSDDVAADQTMPDTSTTPVADSMPSDDANDSSADNSSSTPPVPADEDDLMDIKRQALQQLQPLVGHLEQSPEEKFKTTMMMIQAADDKTLIQTAYEAAQQIGDEKTRAQALLDVINEINYFTHPQEQ